MCLVALLPDLGRSLGKAQEPLLSMTRLEPREVPSDRGAHVFEMALLAHGG